MGKEIPVYVVTGFLESGKTMFIQDTLSDPGFTGKEKTLLIVGEEGEEEYEDYVLKKANTTMVTVEDMPDPDFLEKCQKEYKPDRVMIECNGMWNMEELLNLPLPKKWIFVQNIALADAQTFDNYLSNMRSIMMAQFSQVDMVIFNRCDRNTNKGALRRSIKVFNRQAQIMYEFLQGEEAYVKEEDAFPFRLDAPVIEIEDEDFGLWYIDAMDNADRYVGKTVRFRAVVYKGRPKELPESSFVPGRFAMTCCAEDIAFIGFVCRYPKEIAHFMKKRQDREWVMVTATVGKENMRIYQGEGPVLTAVEIQMAEPPKEDIVYFS